MTPSSLSARRLTSANADLQHHLLALGAAGQLQHVDDVGLARHRRRRSRPARSMTALLETLPVRMMLSSFIATRMSSPGKSCLKRLLERRHAGIDHDVVLAAVVSAPHDQADRARALAVDQDLARLDDDGVGDRRVRDGDARDVERS